MLNPKKSVQCFSFRKTKQLPLSRPVIAELWGTVIDYIIDTI